MTPDLGLPASRAVSWTNHPSQSSPNLLGVLLRGTKGRQSLLGLDLPLETALRFTSSPLGPQAASLRSCLIGPQGMMVFAVPIGTVVGVSLNPASKYTQWAQPGCCCSLPFWPGLLSQGPHLGKVNSHLWQVHVGFKWIGKHGRVCLGGGGG